MSIENLVDLPEGMRLVSAGEVEALARASMRAVGGRDPVSVLLERIASEPLAAWEVHALELAASLRGTDDLALQRMRIALKTQRADVLGWERAVNEARRRTAAPSRAGGPPPQDFEVRERYTDVWNVTQFAHEYRNRVRHVPERGWYAWTGTHWESDDRAGLTFAQEFAREIAMRADSDGDFEPAARAKIAVELMSRSTMTAIESLGRARRELCAKTQEFDQDPMLLNCQNGTVDLRSGNLRPHDPDDLCSRTVEARFDPEATAPQFDAFLARVQPDAEVRAFLQRWAGYCATASTAEQALVLHCGTGANGKSTFVEAINWVMARYAQLVPSDVLLARAGHEAHPTERAQLCGLRHALVSETANGKGWNENAVKQLTGDTKMSARYMRQDFFEFSITHKLSVCTNNRPEVREHSHAFWRRVNLVNWPVQLPEAEKDSGLLDKLRGEAAGILAWIVRGAVAWVREGLAAPEAVKRATSEYRSETDALGMFLEERTQRLDGTRTPASALYKAWAAWVEARGEKAGGGSQTTFGERMAARGLTRVKSSGLMFYRGLALRPQQEREAEDDDRDGDRDGWAEPSMSELSANSQAESATGIVRDSCAPIATPTREPENISHASVADSTRTRALALENEDPFLRVGIIQPTIPNYPCDLGTSDNSQDKPTISPDCQPSLSTLPSPPTEPIEGLDDWEDL